MTTYLVIALTLVIVAHTALLLRVWALLRRPARTEDRLAHFAEALALLTDTTEAGLANVALELESTRRRTPRGTSRAATAKRIADGGAQGPVDRGHCRGRGALRERDSTPSPHDGNEMRLKDGGPNGAVLG